ncbi:hypothetical protein QVD99_006344 [Batrachochytrium dendrobatidis]|nr:hypothetical protein O5D80_003311 [Batrachochytrium dendrobatidis]KAK5667133.1 hypothetical protein QVD99_006344 [Batrachochytrium dendrobatidis]
MLERFEIARSGQYALSCGRQLVSTLGNPQLLPVGRPCILLVNGFRSTFTNSKKARYLEDWCAQQRFHFVTYDHAGHGDSSVAFQDCTIGQWRSDLAVVVEQVTGQHSTICPASPLILVGSSMGLWLSLLVAAYDHPSAISGIIGVGGSINFTERLLKEIPLEIGSVWMRPSRYDPNGYPIHRKLLNSGREHLLIKDTVINCPIELIHGMCDVDVSWEQSAHVALLLNTTSSVVVTLIKDADHRLSAPSDLQVIGQALDRLVEKVSNSNKLG